MISGCMWENEAGVQIGPWTERMANMGFSFYLGGGTTNRSQEKEQDLHKTSFSTPVAQQKVQGDPGAAPGICGIEIQTPSPGKARVSPREGRLGSRREPFQHSGLENSPHRRASCRGSVLEWGWPRPVTSRIPGIPGPRKQRSLHCSKVTAADLGRPQP